MKTKVEFNDIISNYEPFSIGQSSNHRSDLVDSFKTRLKSYSFLYKMLITCISPVCETYIWILKKFIGNPTTEKIVNFGSGTTRLHPNIINIDMFNYDSVDLVCDISRTPFKNGTIDKVVSIAVLEHVRHPEEVVAEIYRVLKPGGQVFCFIPFMQGFHASPDDFRRYTIEGMKILFSSFEIELTRPDGGPTSGMLWILCEWLSIALSFGVERLQIFLYIVFMVITSPLKWLDLILIRHPSAKNISSGFTVIARKPREIELKHAPRS